MDINPNYNSNLVARIFPLIIAARLQILQPAPSVRTRIAMPTPGLPPGLPPATRSAASVSARFANSNGRVFRRAGEPCGEDCFEAVRVLGSGLGSGFSLGLEERAIGNLRLKILELVRVFFSKTTSKIISDY